MKKIGVWPLLVVTLVSAFFFARHSAVRADYPFPLDVGEGEVLNYARMMAAGEPLYRSIGADNATITNYPPVAIWAVAALTDPAHPSFGPGRLLASLCMAWIAACLVVVLRKGKAPWPLAAAMGLAFLANPVIMPFGNLLRVDAVALALSFSGLAMLSVRETRVAAALAGTLFTAALFAKHSSVFAPAAACLYLLVNDRRRLLVLLGVMAALGGGGLLAMQTITGGEFLKHLVTYTYEGWTWWHVLSYMKSRILGPPFVNLALTVSAAAGWIWWTRRQGHRTPAWYYLPAVVPSVLLLGKTGSSALYLQELVLACLLVAGVVLARLTEGEPKPAARAAFLIATLTLALTCAIALPEWTKLSVDPADAERDRKAYTLIQRANKPVFAEDVGVPVVAGKEVPYPNTYSLSWAIENGHWDPAPLLADFASRRFALVYLLSSASDPGPLTVMRIHPAILRAIQTYYPVTWRCGSGFIYLPKRPRPPAAGNASPPASVKGQEGAGPQQRPAPIPDWMDPNLVVPGDGQLPR